MSPLTFLYQVFFPAPVSALIAVSFAVFVFSSEELFDEDVSDEDDAFDVVAQLVKAKAKAAAAAKTKYFFIKLSPVKSQEISFSFFLDFLNVSAMK